MSWSRMRKAVSSLADRARCPAKDRLHSSENLDSQSMQQERRRTPRHPLGRLAALMFGQGQEHPCLVQEHPCLVKDYSDGGVRLQPNGFEVPDDFALLF